MAIAVVGSALQVENSGAGSTLATAARATTTGHFIVVNIKWEDAGTVTGITDTAGNTYTIVEQGGLAPGQALAYAYNITGHASNVITVTWSSASASWRAVQCYFFSGVDTTSPVDGTPTNNSSAGSSTATCGGVTSTGDAVFIYALGYYAAITPTWPGSFVGVTAPSGQSASIGYEIVTGAATRTASITLSGAAAWRMGAAAFKAASGAAAASLIHRPSSYQHLLVR